jgi:hypothetical protein
MREKTAVAMVAGIGLGFLLLPVLLLLGPARVPQARETPPFVGSGSLLRASRRGPADEALREVAVWEVRARQAAFEADAAPSAVDPDALLSASGESDRRRLASEARACLRRARQLALRAATLARTPDEARRAAELLARLSGRRAQKGFPRTQ